MKRLLKSLLCICITLSVCGCSLNDAHQVKPVNNQVSTSVPEYSNRPYAKMNGNVPIFNTSELTTKSYKSFSDLDKLGRCGPAIASIGKDLMPTKKRESIGMVKPTGWHTVRYDDLIKDGKYLYNRSHLIGYQLSGENANDKNLITGTRYLNVIGMEPFENQVAKYVKKTGNHVAYRVTPVFDGNNLLASGVEMEAQSIEDAGKGIRYHVFVYNVQPGITINYADGTSHRPEEREVNTYGNG